MGKSALTFLFLVIGNSLYAQEFTLPSGRQRDEITIKAANTHIYRAIGIYIEISKEVSLEDVIAIEHCWMKTQWDKYVKFWRATECKCDEKFEVVIDSVGHRRIIKFEDVETKFICPISTH